MLRFTVLFLAGPALAAAALACGDRTARDAATGDTTTGDTTTGDTTTGDTTTVATSGANGEELYASACATCHEQDGTGLSAVYPPLAGSEIVAGPVTTLVRIVIGGLEGPLTVKGEQYNSTMLPYGGGPELGDAEVAAVLTYVRKSFGNSAPLVTPEDVARERAATAGRVALWTPAELGIR